MELLWTLFKTALFTVVLPGTIAVYLPDGITRGAIFDGPRDAIGFAALVPLAFGLLLYLRCAWDFAKVGLGTPAPIDPPKTLVVRGPYRWTRNPMYVAVTSVLVGECLMTRSASLSWYALTVFAGFNAFVMLYEEPTLRAKFGDEYRRYCAQVPRWIVKLHVVALVAGSCVAAGITQAPEFDAATIKPNKAGEGASGIRFSPGGHFAWTNVTLRQLMNSAYSDHRFADVVGGPKWVYTDRFDVAATSPSALSSIGPDGAPTLLFAMLRQLIESRFRLSVRDAVEERPIYALQLANPKGALGSRLVKADVDCGAVSQQMARGEQPPRKPGQPPPCSIGNRPGRLTAAAIPLSRLADALQQFVDRPVTDRTGLPGGFDVDLQWTPDLRVGDPADPTPPVPAADAPSIFTALQEQLGLKLQPTRGPVRVLVIDRVEPLLPN